MLRTNLSSRPFYNVRAINAAVTLLAVLVVIVTLFNVVQYVRLSARERSLGADAAQAEREAADLRGRAAQLRAQIDPKELQVVAAAAREANTVIDQRAFSWTDLFSQFEQTLPEDVRITAVQPRVEQDGRLVIEVQVQARRVEDIDAFIEALEARGSFRSVQPRREQAGEGGLIEGVIDAEYAMPASRDVARTSGGAR